MEIQDYLKWYQIEAKRTCPDLGSESVNLAHMVLGICSEYEELLDAEAKDDVINYQEEWVDALWYVSNYCNFRDYSLADLWQKALIESENFNLSKLGIKNYFYCLSKLQDLVKKNLAYSKEINIEKEEDALVSFLITAQWLASNKEFDIVKGLENNINKLRIRFPKSFDKELAVNRNLEAERKELEK